MENPNKKYGLPGRRMPPKYYAIRIRRPYSALATAMGDWAMRSTGVIVYEHPEPNNVHCHMLLRGVYVDAETLKNDLRKRGLDCARAEWSFKTTFKTPDGGVVEMSEETAKKYITYMSKGKYEPKYLSAYNADECELAKTAWVVYKKSSRDSELYDKFIAFTEQTEQKVWLNDKNYSLVINQLHALAMKFMHQELGVINLQARRDGKMLKDTWLVNNNQLDYYKLKLPFE